MLASLHIDDLSFLDFSLEILYLGGNQLTNIPDELGYVSSLTMLVLCDNRLESLPRSLINLRMLQSLSLHNNRLATLPPEIIRLNLVELSLRNNPLVVRFVEEMTYEPPSLLELAGRMIKVKNVRYTPDDLPASLYDYLNSAQSCVNPKCKGLLSVDFSLLLCKQREQY
jgi:Leucine rich repeat